VSSYKSNDLLLSYKIESLLVQRNLRGMQQVQKSLKAGYCLRAADILQQAILYKKENPIFIGTGFPVGDTFETDGPVGAVILYRVLKKLGAKPVLVCGGPIAEALQQDYCVYNIYINEKHIAEDVAAQAHSQLQPSVVFSIERPGFAKNGRYHNMRGEDISDDAACFDYFVTLAKCPTIAIGDGGNEIGMGNVANAIAGFDIIPAITPCDELIIADVSNWGVYGLLTFLSRWHQQDLLADVCPKKVLQFLSAQGSVDGVTRKNELTEDGLPASEGIALIKQFRQLIELS